MISPDRLAREFAALWRRTPPALRRRRYSLAFSRQLDRTNARNPRRYAEMDPETLTFYFARAILALPHAYRRALVAHEIGHALTPGGSEADADRAAERVLGVKIGYDKQNFPGKGLQVAVGARRNPQDEDLRALERAAKQGDAQAMQALVNARIRARQAPTSVEELEVALERWPDLVKIGVVKRIPVREWARGAYERGIDLVSALHTPWLGDGLSAGGKWWGRAHPGPERVVGTGTLHALDGEDWLVAVEPGAPPEVHRRAELMAKERTRRRRGRRPNPQDEDLRRLIQGIKQGDRDALRRFTAVAQREGLPEPLLRQAWRATVDYAAQVLHSTPGGSTAASVERWREAEDWSEARYPLQRLIADRAWAEGWSTPWWRKENPHDEDLRRLRREVKEGKPGARLRYQQARKRQGTPLPKGAPPPRDRIGWNIRRLRSYSPSGTPGGQDFDRGPGWYIRIQGSRAEAGGDLGEGPFDTKQQAEDYANAEVGVPWSVAFLNDHRDIDRCGNCLAPWRPYDAGLLELCIYCNSDRGPTRRNPHDEDLRRLERRARTGDSDAARRLGAVKKRVVRPNWRLKVFGSPERFFDLHIPEETVQMGVGQWRGPALHLIISKQLPRDVQLDSDTWPYVDLEQGVIEVFGWTDETGSDPEKIGVAERVS